MENWRVKTQIPHCVHAKTKWGCCYNDRKPVGQARSHENLPGKKVRQNSRIRTLFHVKMKFRSMRLDYTRGIGPNNDSHTRTPGESRLSDSDSDSALDGADRPSTSTIYKCIYKWSMYARGVTPLACLRLQASGFRLQASGMGLFYLRVNEEALVTGSIAKWRQTPLSRWHDQGQDLSNVLLPYTSF